MNGEGVERAGDEVTEEGIVSLNDLEVGCSCKAWKCRVSRYTLFYCCIGDWLEHGHGLTGLRIHC